MPKIASDKRPDVGFTDSDDVYPGQSYVGTSGDEKEK